MNMTTVNDAGNDESGLVSMIGGNGGEGGGGGGGVEEVALKKGPWTTAEDAILIDYVTKHGEGNWNAVQRNTGLARCGKSCRLRWANHLRPNLKKGAFSPEEEKLIVELHAQFGNKWARMAALLPGRTDNEIKNYWNTRVKRRQRQGLPLYSDDHDHPTTPTTPTTPSPCVTPTGSNPNTVTKFDFLHQNQHQHQHNHHHHHSPLSPTTQPAHNHSPLSSPLNHRPPPSYSPHHFLDPAPSYSNPSLSTTAPSTLSFTFQRPTPVLGNPLRFKRFRSSQNFSLLHLPSITPYSSTTPDQMADLDAFRFPLQHNSNFSSQYFQTPLLDSDRVVSAPNSVFPSKLEHPSNQFSQSHQEPVVKHDMEFNDPTLQTSSGLLGDLLLEAQALASGQNSKKRNYLSLNEGNDVLDGYQNFEDWPLSSTYWSSTSGVKPKEEASDLSKPVNEDLSKLLTVMPSTMQDTNWHNNSAAELSNVQSSGITTDDNFGLDIKPIASLFPLTNTTNHNENQGYYSWDNLPSLC
ncbi:hypothetical protein RIF29_00862 [Crotalaria pallida]|uniref:Uncharacterized protein n=1 Tax=Crotalaria pallida TaxID=3830 RepID=A0AAN9IWQ4_CROPI